MLSRLTPWLLCAPLLAQTEDLDALVKRVVELYATVEREAADPVASEQAFYGGVVPGMLRRLDPHSVFFDQQQFEQLRELETSTRKGFGSVVSVLPGRVLFLQTMPGSPSQRAGLAPGDEIIAINNIALNRLDTDQLIQLLTESRQREAQLMVRRPNSPRLLSFQLTPAIMDAPSVERSFLVAPGVVYLRVGSFEAGTGREIKDAIDKLGASSLKGLVLDLRNNPGGVLGAAFETCSMFLAPGTKIVSVRGRSKKEEDITVPKAFEQYGFPVAVLLNAKSASAAEVVAGALQDHKRAVVLGEQSFGKGLVQSVYPLSSNNGLALTTAFYYTPNGRNIQRPLKEAQIATEGGEAGIVPDIRVLPEASTRLRLAVEATASFTEFATEYARSRGGTVRENFEVTPGLLDEFQGFLARRNIQPGVGEWTAERPWVESRLTQEILNQTLGVARGDEVEARRDPVVRRALQMLEKP